MTLSKRPNPFLVVGGVLLIWATIWAIITFWNLLVIVVISIVVARLVFYHGYVLPKIAKVQQSNLVKAIVNEEDFYYTIPLEIKEEKKQIPEELIKLGWVVRAFNCVKGNKEWKVRCVLPELDNYNLELRESIYNLGEVEIVTRADNNLSYQKNYYLATTIKNLLHKLSPQLDDLNQNRERLNKELELFSLSPDIYSQEIDIYSKTVEKIQGLIQSGEEIRDRGLELIQDVLIGTELSNYEPKNVPGVADSKIRFEAQCKALGEQYQTLKQEIKANSKLRKKTGKAT